MTDFILGLEQDLVTAAHLRAGGTVIPLRARPPLRSLLVAAALVVVIVATAAGATLYVLRGSVIPAPSERDAGPAQSVAAGTAHLLPLRAADPDGGARWALRVAQSKTGFVCSTVGQMVGGTLGIVGLDRRFRALAPGVVDGCSQSRRNRSTLIGARVFDARRRIDPRTIVYGVAGSELTGARMSSGVGSRLLPIGPGGTFLAALRGYPEDIGIRLKLRFRDGHVERYPLGTSAFVVADPLGGPAWKTTAGSYSGHSQLCVTFQFARDQGPLIGVSPAACGQSRGGLGPFFAVRRLEPTKCSGSGGPNHLLREGLWCRIGARTAVWGYAGVDITRVTVIGPHLKRDVPISPGDTFLAVLEPRINPKSLSVRMGFADGTVHTYRGDTGLVPPPRVQ